MRRSSFCRALLVTVTAMSVVSLNGQTCNDCKPPRLNAGWDLQDGAHTVCFQSNSDHSWTPTQRSQMETGFNKLKDTLAASGRNVNFSFVHQPWGSPLCGADSIKVVPKDFSSRPYPGAGADAAGTSDGRGAEISINKNNVGGVIGHAENHWEFVGAHEGGHLTDLANVDSPPYPAACQSMTFMFNVQAALPANNCGDVLTLTAKYNPPVRRDNDQDEYSPDDPENSEYWEPACADDDPEATSCPPEEPNCSSCTFSANGPGDCSENGGYYIHECACCVDPWSPILIALDDPLELSSDVEGVVFDLASNGTPRRIPWPTHPGVAWLVLDRNANGVIDNGREMFGNFTLLASGTRAKNGYLSLAEFDTNHDGRITSADSVFGQLRLWRDTVRNGVTDAGELLSLQSLEVVEISLDYKKSQRTDRWGNRFRFRAPVRFSSQQVVYSWDVFLPPPTGAIALGRQRAGAAVCPVPSSRLTMK